MTLFIAVHKWKPEENLAILKEMEAFAGALGEGKFPKGVELLSSYSRDNGAFCVWSAPNQAVLEQTFDQFAPVMKKVTEFVPVLQFYPPTVEYVRSLWQTMLAYSAPK